MQILIDLCRRPRCIFTHIQVSVLAQSLMRWKNLKGQIMFKWHFDDISLACLTFGKFHFSCELHLIHAEPFLIPNTTKHQFLWLLTNLPTESPLDAALGITNASIQPHSKDNQWVNWTVVMIFSSYGPKRQQQCFTVWLLCMYVSITSDENESEWVRLVYKLQTWCKPAQSLGGREG